MACCSRSSRLRGPLRGAGCGAMRRSHPLLPRVVAPLGVLPRERLRRRDRVPRPALHGQLARAVAGAPDARGRALFRAALGPSAGGVQARVGRTGPVGGLVEQNGSVALAIAASGTGASSRSRRLTHACGSLRRRGRRLRSRSFAHLGSLRAPGAALAVELRSDIASPRREPAGGGRRRNQAEPSPQDVRFLDPQN